MMDKKELLNIKQKQQTNEVELLKQHISTALAQVNSALEIVDIYKKNRYNLYIKKQNC